MDGGKPIMPSPRDSVSGTVKGANIKIAFGAPSVRGRKIFGDGGLQPYGNHLEGRRQPKDHFYHR